MLTAPDQGWAWVVMIASFGLNVAGGCLAFSIGIVQLSLIARFSDTKMKTSLAGSLFLFFYSSGGVPASVFIARWGCRMTSMIGSVVATIGFLASVFVPSLDWLIFTYGLVGGFGISLAYTSAIMAIAFNFKKHRNLATGFSVAGNGVGTIVFPVILDVVVNTYGHIAIFIVMASLSFQMFAFGFAFFPSQLEQKSNYEYITSNERNVFIKKQCNKCAYVLKYYRFLLFCVCLLIASVGNSIIYAHLPSMCRSTGHTGFQASLLITTAGICSLVFRFLTGLMTNSGDIDERIVYLGSYGILGLTTLLFPLFSEKYEGQTALAIVFGIYFANVFPLLNSINYRLVGLQKIALAYGVEMIFVGTGELVGPPLAGFILDMGGSFEHCFILSDLKNQTSVISAKGYKNFLQLISKEHCVYIGRHNKYVTGSYNSKWGNPFCVNVYGRKLSVELYKKYLGACLIVALLCGLTSELFPAKEGTVSIWKDDSQDVAVNVEADGTCKHKLLSRNI